MAHPIIWHVELIIETPMRLHSTLHEYVVAKDADDARARAELRVNRMGGRQVHEIRVVERGRFVPDP